MKITELIRYRISFFLCKKFIYSIISFRIYLYTKVGELEMIINKKK